MVIKFLKSLIPSFIHTWYENYKENQKWREFYARLDRNGEGKFDMKQHRKEIDAAKKKRIKDRRNHQEDLK